MKPAQEDKFALLREKMVAQQIEARGIKDARVLKVMRAVPRHRFIPASNKAWAYDDIPVDIGEGQTISQPYIVALMSELLCLQGSEKVLEIGTGSGYQTAVLAELAGQVYSLEIIASFLSGSLNLLEGLGYRNVHLKTGDGYQGWPEQAPFERIMVTAAPAEIPGILIDQLAEGGIMVVPVGTSYQRLEVVRKKLGRVQRSVMIPVRFVPMVKG